MIIDECILVVLGIILLKGNGDEEEEKKHNKTKFSKE